MKFQGFVANIQERSNKPGAKRAWTLYSFKLEQDNGVEYDNWITFGFDKPPFAVGDYIQCDAEADEKGFYQYIKGSGNKVKNPPARAGAKPSGSAVQAGSVAATPAGSNAPASSQTATTGADRQTQIVLQHSQEIAIRKIALLLENNALPMTGASTKAGEAKRFAELSAAIDKETVKAYNDVVTGRLLTLVADTLPDTSPDGQIPPAAGNAQSSKDDDLGA